MRRFAVLNIMDYNSKIVAFTLHALFSFSFISLLFDMEIYITRSTEGTPADRLTGTWQRRVKNCRLVTLASVDEILVQTNNNNHSSSSSSSRPGRTRY